MAYSLQEDFNYVQNTLVSMTLAIGLDVDNFINYTLNDLMEACSNIFGNAESDGSSPIAMNQYAKLRLNQLSIRRFWYMYHVLNWRINNE